MEFRRVLFRSNLKPVQAATHRGIVFAEPPSFRLVGDLKDSQTERSSRRHHPSGREEDCAKERHPKQHKASQPYQYGVFFVHSDLGYFRCSRSNASRLYGPIDLSTQPYRVERTK